MNVFVANVYQVTHFGGMYVYVYISTQAYRSNYYIDLFNEIKYFTFHVIICGYLNNLCAVKLC